MSLPIYLDHNASAPLDPAVREAMLPFLGEQFGNSRSAHAYGKRLKDAIEQARIQVAEFIGARPEEIVFTGGGSEANNLAIKGLAWANPERKHLMLSAIDHYAISGAVEFLTRHGYSSSVVPVDSVGRIGREVWAAAVRPDTLLACVQHANNEIGTVQDAAALAELAHVHGARVHVDAAQSAGKLLLRVDAIGADLLAMAPHKFGGPAGIGALYVRSGVKLEPLIHGAGHEHGLRSGTHPVALIVGMGEACERAGRGLTAESERLRALRERLLARLRVEVPDVHLNGDAAHCLPHTLNVSFPGLWGGAVLEQAPGVAATTGAACHSGIPEPSLTLRAIGAPSEIGIGAVRLSLGHRTTEAEVDEAARQLGTAVRRLRQP